MHNIQLATLCYIRDDNKTLMLHRIKKDHDIHKGKWNGLGGKFMPGETPEECAVREIREESGLNAERLILKGIITFPLFDGLEDWYVYVFIVNKFSGILSDSPEGVLKWIDNDKLLKLPLWEGDKIFIPWLNQKDFFSAKFIYKSGRLISHEVIFYPI